MTTISTKTIHAHQLVERRFTRKWVDPLRLETNSRSWKLVGIRENRQGDGYAPVDDLVLVQVLQAEDDAGGVEDGARLRKDVGVDVHHQVTSRRVLHHETHVRLSTAAATRTKRPSVTSHSRDPMKNWAINSRNTIRTIRRRLASADGHSSMKGNLLKFEASFREPFTIGESQVLRNSKISTKTRDQRSTQRRKWMRPLNISVIQLLDRVRPKKGWDEA